MLLGTQSGWPLVCPPLIVLFLTVLESSSSLCSGYWGMGLSSLQASCLPLLSWGSPNPMCFWTVLQAWVPFQTPSFHLCLVLWIWKNRWQWGPDPRLSTILARKHCHIQQNRLDLSKAWFYGTSCLQREKEPWTCRRSADAYSSHISHMVTLVTPRRACVCRKHGLFLFKVLWVRNHDPCYLSQHSDNSRNTLTSSSDQAPDHLITHLRIWSPIHSTDHQSSQLATHLLNQLHTSSSDHPSAQVTKCLLIWLPIHSTGHQSAQLIIHTLS